MSAGFARGSGGPSTGRTAGVEFDWTPRVHASGFTFLEAPRWHRGRLYVSDFHSLTVHAVTDEGAVSTVCHVPGTPSGLGFSQDGRLMVVSMADNSVLMADPLSSELTGHADLRGLQRGPANDMLVDRHGRAYVGCDGFDEDAGEAIRSAPLVMVEPSGHASVVAHGLMYPNGMALAADGQTLYVAETLAGRISAFRVAADGSLSQRRTWAAFGEVPKASMVSDAISRLSLMPDGLALDISGAIWVADANGHGVSLVREGGAVSARIDTGPLAVYAVALGGTDLRTLFMCASPPISARASTQTPHAVLLACRVPTPGVPTY